MQIKDNNMTQNEKILKHLQDGNSITPLEALKLFGCFRLSARILDLRGQGHQIITDTVTHNGKKFASYYLIKSKV